MYKNEILDEIHKYREEYAQSFQYDLENSIKKMIQ
jgi:hypothetical protein